MNAYEIFREIRDGIGEETAAHWSDLSILRKMNQAQKILWQDMLKTTGDWFLTSIDVVPDAESTIVFDRNLGRVVYMEIKGSRSEIPIIGTVREKRLSQGVSLTPSDLGLSAYFVGSGLKVNLPNFTDTVTLWFQERLLDMHFGVAGPNSAISQIHLDMNLAPNFATNYYKDLGIEVWTFTGLPKIESKVLTYDSATNIATFDGTEVANPGDFYGTVPQLPEEGHHIIGLDVMNKCLLKPGSSFDIEYVKLSYATLREARNNWLEWIAMRASKHSYIKRREE